MTMTQTDFEFSEHYLYDIAQSNLTILQISVYLGSLEFMLF